MKEVTIVFDLDGTLIDTAPDLINALNNVLEHIGLAGVEQEIARTWISFGARHMIVQALEHAKKPVSEAEIDELLERFLDHYLKNIAALSRPFPGVLDALDRLLDHGARLAVCTNKREALARALLDELSMTSRFQALTGRDTLATCKPDPAHILGTIAMAGGTPDKAVMVGDSLNDIKAAKAAFIPSIAVTFGYSKTKPSHLGADILIDDFSKLLQSLATLLNVDLAPSFDRS